MPRYFFNVYDGYSQLDLVGTPLPDIYTAQDAAIRLSGELLRESGHRFWNEVEWRLEVVDEAGRVLFVLRFSAEERNAGLNPSTGQP